jgi:hypothetical protein
MLEAKAFYPHRQSRWFFFAKANQKKKMHHRNHCAATVSASSKHLSQNGSQFFLT